MFVLVRHAHAGNKATWRGPDTERPLSDKGQRQALGLAVALRRVRIRAVWSSPTARCRLTVAPLARERQLRIQDQALLLPDADLSALLALLAEPTSGGAVLCTHGETLTGLLPHWQESASSDAPLDNVTAKGAAWIVRDFPGPRPQLHYVHPRPE